MTEHNDRSPRYRERWHRRLDAAGLPPDLDRLALVLASKARADGTRAVASHRWLATRLGKSERTMRRWVAELDAGHWIERVEKGTRKGSRVTANVYRLTIPGEVSTGHLGDGPLSAGHNRPRTTDQPATGTGSTGHGPAENVAPPREDPPSTRGTAPAAVPPEFVPSAQNVALAARIGADLEHERRAFLRKYLGSDVLRADWQATFRRWLENVEQRGPSPAEQAAAPSGYYRADDLGAVDWGNATAEQLAAQQAVLDALPPAKASPW